MRDDKCIFCKLANGIIPTNSIYEDENFIACFTEMERNMLFRKDDCSELMLEKMRNAITPKKKSKLKRHKIKGDILFAVIAIPIIIYII